VPHRHRDVKNIARRENFLGPERVQGVRLHQVQRLPRNNQPRPSDRANKFAAPFEPIFYARRFADRRSEGFLHLHLFRAFLRGIRDASFVRPARATNLH
jgi:hypothetical protein